MAEKRSANAVKTISVVMVVTLLGKVLGLRLLERMELEGMKKWVYLFVGASGILTVLQQI